VLMPSLTNRFKMMVLLAFCGELLAQNPQVKTRAGSRFPTVIFTSVLWSADPSYYSIAVDSTGTATYQSAPESLERTGVPYTIEFHVSDRTRRTTFNLARRLDFFRGEMQEQQLSAAKNWVHTLVYHDLQFSTQLTYSGSSNSDIEELTSIFEELSETLEYGRRLAYLQQHDRKAIGSELRRLQANADRHVLRERQTIAPVLRSLTADAGLDGETRHAAQALLDPPPGQMGSVSGRKEASGASKP
jgi:hypothetical protein